MKSFVAYYRVSTDRQGRSGLGLAAQRSTVAAFLEGSQGGKLVAEFSEAESGNRKDRPVLAKAIELCRRSRARLVIAKLDRLARNAAFLLSLRDSGVDFVACDTPNADRFTVGVLALVAEKEAEMISERTRAALAALKRRGVTLGNPKLAHARADAVAATKRKAKDYAQTLKPVVREIESTGVRSRRGIAICLNRRGYRTARGNPFTSQAVRNLLNQITPLIGGKVR